MADTLDARKIFMNRTYSVTLDHINKVKELADELMARAADGKVIGDGEVVRRAIDLLYAQTYNEPLPGKKD